MKVILTFIKKCNHLMLISAYYKKIIKCIITKRWGRCINPISLTMGILYLMPVIWKLKWENKGIKIDGEIFTHLRFVNDIVLASHDPKELHTMLKELNREGKTVEIEINLKKTQVMFNEQINGEMEVKIDQTRLHISRATNHHPAK